MTPRLLRLALLLALIALPVAAGNINLEFQGAPVPQIYETLGDLAGYNVLLAPSVQGTATLSLNDVGAWEAMELVASLLGHELLLRHSTVLIAPRGVFSQLASEVLVVHTVSYLSQEQVREALGLLLPPGKIYTSSDGTVVLQGEERVIAEAGQLLKMLDRPPLRPTGSRDLLSLLEDITAELDLNLVADPSLASEILSVNLRRGEALQVLSDLREMANLQLEQRGDTLYATRPQIQLTPERERLKLYRLNYASPQVAMEAVSMLVASDRIRVDTKTNTLMVRGTESLLEEVDQFIAELDQPMPQVLLEVWVHEMTTNALLNLGVEWKGIPSFEGFQGAPTFLEFSWEPWELLLALKVLEEEGKAQVLANPKITTLSGQEASIFVGDRVPIVLKGEEGSNTLEFIDSGINLKVTPRISDDGYITIRVRPEVSTFFWRPETDYPQVRTREAETTVRVRDGQPIMIGGLLQEEDRDKIKKIPIISELPVLGNLFRWTEKQGEKTEMNIFLIPRIIDGSQGVGMQSFFTVTQ